MQQKKRFIAAVKESVVIVEATREQVIEAWNNNIVAQMAAANLGHNGWYGLVYEGVKTLFVTPETVKDFSKLLPKGVRVAQCDEQVMQDMGEDLPWFDVYISAPDGTALGHIECCATYGEAITLAAKESEKVAL